MPIDLSAMLDQLEEWIESQVPPNLHDLPGKVLETVERVSNELSESGMSDPERENVTNRFHSRYAQHAWPAVDLDPLPSVR